MTNEKLCAAYQNGDLHAGDRLVAQIDDYIHWCASRVVSQWYTCDTQTRDDLEAAGRFGLAKAMNRFDSTRGVKFSTFARPYVAGGMLRYMRDYHFTIAIPRWLQEKSKTPEATAAIWNTQPVELDVDNCPPLKQFEDGAAVRMVLANAVGQLKDIQQQVVYEYFFEELNQTEIARKLGISCNYVSSSLRNATKRLRKILATEDFQEASRAAA